MPTENKKNAKLPAKNCVGSVVQILSLLGLEMSKRNLTSFCNSNSFPAGECDFVQIERKTAPPHNSRFFAQIDTHFYHFL